jgi:transcriptional regulator with XRE-family HTH domain
MAKSGPHKPRPKVPPKQWGRNYVKEWRIFREMTVDDLSAATGMSTGNISALENRRQGYSAEGLEKLAKALKTTPAALLGVNPLADGTDSFWLIWEKTSPQDRETLKIMANRLVEAGGSRK